MNTDELKGNWKVAKGKVKEEVGHVTGNTSTEAEGVADQVKGRFQKSFGKAKDALKKSIDTIANK